MFNIFALLSFPFFIISAYYFNNQKMIASKPYILLISSLEAILCYLIALLLFLQGFLSIFFVLVVIIILIPITGITIFSIEREYGIDDEFQIETVKNSLILFILTLLPFYVFLTIFRYLPFYFQIPLAVSLTALLFFLSKKIYTPVSLIYDRIAKFIFEMGSLKYIYLWISIPLIVLLNVLFQLPTNVVGNNLNLSNNVSYLAFDGFPTTINNNYQQNEIIQIDSDQFEIIQFDSIYPIEFEITDYYYDNSHLYIYTDRNHILCYDLSTKEVIYNIDLETGETHEESNSVYASALHNKFIYHNGYLILLGTNDTYLLTTTDATKISSISSYYAKYFYLENELHFLNKISDTVFEIYKFEDGVISLSETTFNLK